MTERIGVARIKEHVLARDPSAGLIGEQCRDIAYRDVVSTGHRLQQGAHRIARASRLGVEVLARP